MPSARPQAILPILLGSIATGSRSGHRPALSSLGTQLSAIPSRARCVRAQRPRRCGGAVARDATRKLGQRGTVDGCTCARASGHRLRACRLASKPDWSLARAGCRSASRWQYCPAVSAVLPEVARRHPASPSSREKPYRPRATQNDYSSRSVCMGSTDDARRAGNQHAASVAASSNTPTLANVATSSGCTP